MSGEVKKVWLENPPPLPAGHCNVDRYLSREAYHHAY
jgi:hypothetical protein